MAERNRSSLRRAQLALFASNFLRHPKMLGSIVPSSRFLVDEVLDRIDWPQANVVVEYGPGVGTFTAEILKRMRPGATLIAIEMNQEFVRFLSEELPDPRLRVVEGSAANIQRILREHGHDRADYIVSGIPFSTMSDDVREAVLRASRAALASDGAFLVYQFSSRVLPDLERIFGTVERRFEPLNILPAQLFFCEAA
jgi:phospholipid N-methyltransferase